jgi:hypothetical protein
MSIKFTQCALAAALAGSLLAGTLQPWFQHYLHGDAKHRH